MQTLAAHQRQEQRIGKLGRPWLGWGPYLWTDGLRGRSDGLKWRCTDVQSDGTHPSPDGVHSVAKQLLNSFTSDPTTRPWFVAAGRLAPKSR